jgi:serine protease Do
LAKPEGALVSNVDRDGPADKAGLQTGDVILKANGQAIASASDLPAVIGAATPGQKIGLEVWRQGKLQDFSVNLADASEKPGQSALAQDTASHGKLGLALRPLQAQELREAGVHQGLLIEEVAGPAAAAGVQVGDVLLAVNGTSVQSVEQVRRVIDKADKSLALLIQRDGSKIFVPVRLG